MAYGNNAIRVTSSDKMPKVDHWAIITYDTIYTPGDERSRTHPGHGYPASSDSVACYAAYLDEEDWKKSINELTFPSYGSPKQFTAIVVKLVKITKSVSVEIDA